MEKGRRACSAERGCSRRLTGGHIGAAGEMKTDKRRQFGGRKRLDSPLGGAGFE